MKSEETSQIRRISHQFCARKIVFKLVVRGSILAVALDVLLLVARPRGYKFMALAHQKQLLEADQDLYLLLTLFGFNQARMECVPIV